jgi:hypothetical protein
LEKKDWKIEQPFKEHPEIMIIKSYLKTSVKKQTKKIANLSYFY